MKTPEQIVEGIFYWSEKLEQTQYQQCSDELANLANALDEYFIKYGRPDLSMVAGDKRDYRGVGTKELLAECKESRIEGVFTQQHKGSFARTLEALAAEITMEDAIDNAGEWSDWLLSKAMHLDNVIIKAEGQPCET